MTAFLTHWNKIAATRTAQVPIEDSRDIIVQENLIHVVDDDAGLRESLQFLLGTLGYATCLHADPVEFLSAIDSLEPGLILLDIRFPEHNGLDILEQLRAGHCYWPVVIVTGHGDIALAVKAIKLGAEDFLEKPFNPLALEDVVGAGIAKLPDAVARSHRHKAAAAIIARLTMRQKQVFLGVVAGLTSKEIALKYALSPRTVEFYRVNLMQRLGVSKAVDLLQFRDMVLEMHRDRI